MTFDKPFIIIGAGGHGAVVLDLLLERGAQVLFMTDSNAARHGNDVWGIPVGGGDERIDSHPPASVNLAMGVGIAGRGHDLMANLQRRLDLARAFTDRGYQFPPLVHPAASVGRNTAMSDGAQIMAGAVIQPNCRIGAFAIINTGATVDHDSTVGNGSHVAPGVTLCGRVSVGDASYIGTGATVVNNRNLGDRVFVTAGTLVTRDAPMNTRVSATSEHDTA